jgi:L-fuculose-phosphate aldolase
MAAYYKMETIEHFAQISLVARLLGGERLLTRDEVVRLQGLRGSYGIASPAPICIDGAPTTGEVACQVVQAPAAPRPGQRLVGDPARTGTPADGEIRLTYRELAALIEDAVKAMR